MYLVNKNAQQIHDQTLYFLVKRIPKFKVVSGVSRPVQYFAIFGLGFISTCTKDLWGVVPTSRAPLC